MRCDIDVMYILCITMKQSVHIYTILYLGVLVYIIYIMGMSIYICKLILGKFFVQFF